MTNVGIYKITSPSGRVYIGQSWNLKKRKSQYEYFAFGQPKKQKKIYNSIVKYGWEAHKHEIIHYLPVDVTQDIMDNYEILYWQLHKDCGVNVLNIREPGSKGKMSEEEKEHQRIVQTGKKMPLEAMERTREATYKKVSQYDAEGNFIKSFKGIKFAAEELNINPKGISECCNNGLLTFKGFRWKLDNDKTPFIFSIYKKPAKKVIQMDLNNNFIKEWNSSREIEEHLKILVGNISACCMNRREYTGGFKWKYA